MGKTLKRPKRHARMKQILVIESQFGKVQSNALFWVKTQVPDILWKTWGQLWS